MLKVQACRRSPSQHPNADLNPQRLCSQMNTMNSQKAVALVALTVSLVFAGACRKQQTATQAPAPVTTAPTTGSPEQLQQAAGALTPGGQTKFFKGSIGSTAGLQMKLTREGDNLKGAYFYQKVGTRIDLKGTVDKDGNLTLEEYDPAGKQTGLFKGIWKTDLDDGLISIAGNWSKPGGEKKTAFSIHEEPIELSGGAEIVGKRIKETNKKLKYEIDAEYPQVTAPLDMRFDKFNQEAKSLVVRKVAAFKADMISRAAVAEPSPETETATPGSDIGVGYTIKLAKDDVISILFDIGGYSSGAAHPNSYTDVLNYDVKAGKTLKLADAFKPGAKYLQTLSAYCIKELKRQSKAQGSSLPDDMIQSGAGPKANNYKSWVITKKGLEISFDPYQVGPYAAGPQSVLVPYAELKDIIKPDGPLGVFVK